MNQRRCIVIGAGISGLLAARELTSAGLEVTVLDKGRGVGGRMATRRAVEAVFDHGAQFMSATDNRFLRLVDQWTRDALTAPWPQLPATFPDSPFPAASPPVIGTSGMTTVPKYLASQCTVQLQTHVTSLKPDDGRWTIGTHDSNGLHADIVLATSPLPQTLAFLDAGGTRLERDLGARLRAIAYAPCLACLLQFDSVPALPDHGAVAPGPEPLQWIADNHRKGISPVPAVTMHAGPEFSRRYFSQPEELVIQKMVAAARRYLPDSPRAAQLHRWRFSKPLTTVGEPVLLAITNPPLVLAGDAFGGPGVEGAALSGLAAADFIRYRTTEGAA